MLALTDLRGRVLPMTKASPKEFRDDVVCVAPNRQSGVLIANNATDFGVHPMQGPVKVGCEPP